MSLDERGRGGFQAGQRHLVDEDGRDPLLARAHHVHGRAQPLAGGESGVV